jgi:hypothetical protein
MPKAEPHFDAEALVLAVHQQDLGLRITTNNPSQFRQIVYKAARKLGRRVHIFSYGAKRPNSFALMHTAPEGIGDSTVEGGEDEQEA